MALSKECLKDEIIALCRAYHQAESDGGWLVDDLWCKFNNMLESLFDKQVATCPGDKIVAHAAALLKQN
ncbi:hypothetical protein C1H76_2984 [Elsinoe australis]|uniref:Uncharacterized protein n=1 Tax=Elsinoe australis TaxID=40998 RepID=A0A4U7B1Z9_9PEZI|nr:hypothetical protein C1H76_2984 [Elsinoe australis]